MRRSCSIWFFDRAFPAVAFVFLSFLAFRSLAAQEPAIVPPPSPAPAVVDIPTGEAAVFSGEALVPAAFGIWTDRAGSSWSVEATGNVGRIGSTMVNSGLALLVNEEKFEVHQPMMTADGKEMVLQGLPIDALPGLRVQRRVRLLEEPGGLRYAELFHNGSADPVSITVGLATNFSGNFKTFLSDRGRSEPLLLGPAETGIIVLPGSSQSSRAFLFTLADTVSGKKPTISSQNRYGLTFRYQLDLAPGETGVIVHHVGQVVIPQSFDRRTLLRLCQPFALEKIRGSFDEDWSDRIVNALEPASASPRSVFLAGSLLSLGVPPGASDTLAIGPSTRLVGAAEGGPVKVVSPYGEGLFPLEQIAAIVGGKSRADGRIRLFLRDGQILSGIAETPGLGFLPTNGSRITLDPAMLDRLVFGGGGVQGEWPSGVEVLIETHDGDRIKPVGTGTISLSLVTPWGILPVSLADLLWLKPAPGGGSRVELKNGTVCDGFVEAPSIEIAGTSLGDVALPAPRLRHLLTRSGFERERGKAGPPVGSFLRLAGDQILVGPISNTTLPVLSEGVALEVSMSEVRRVVRLDEAPTPTMDRPNSARFRLERWDGGNVTGFIPLDTISVEIAGRTWQIPLRDIIGIELVSPSLTPDTLTRIEGLIRNLGSPDWSTRETATRELGAFGYLARPVLQRELGTVSDPEVERRLERVLSDLN